MGRKAKFEKKSFMGFDNLEFFKSEDKDDKGDEFNIGALIGGILGGLILLLIVFVFIRKAITFKKKKYEKKEYIDDNFNEIQLEFKSLPIDDLKQINDDEEI